MLVTINAKLLDAGKNEGCVSFTLLNELILQVIYMHIILYFHIHLMVTIHLLFQVHILLFN